MNLFGNAVKKIFKEKSWYISVSTFVVFNNKQQAKCN
jgi:hypothetical protein